MGLARYFRKYIPEFASRTACISKLTKKSERFVWGSLQDIAMNYVCAYLSKRPLLTIYYAALPIKLHTDGSAIGFGAILFQRHGKHLKVVSYFSRRATAVESKYHSCILEILAAFYAIRHFRVYLLGTHFKLVTDCNSLKLTQNKKDIIPRGARCWLYLQDFNFDIEYSKGKYTPHADYLGKNPIRMKYKSVSV